ncbi:hypothetical protein DER46DRAFT_608391 [Fusarium sp. MPI-SDFR-AT-0072]|nr:hypothetical protein DER46DRAFT_608391 [Fusarium sp. MPI-SDFR-AT-0072]
MQVLFAGLWEICYAQELEDTGLLKKTGDLTAPKVSSHHRWSPYTSFEPSDSRKFCPSTYFSQVERRRWLAHDQASLRIQLTDHRSWKSISAALSVLEPLLLVCYGQVEQIGKAQKHEAG